MSLLWKTQGKPRENCFVKKYVYGNSFPHVFRDVDKLYIQTSGKNIMDAITKQDKLDATIHMQERLMQTYKERL